MKNASTNIMIDVNEERLCQDGLDLGLRVRARKLSLVMNKNVRVLLELHRDVQDPKLTEPFDKKFDFSLECHYYRSRT